MRKAKKSRPEIDMFDALQQLTLTVRIRRVKEARLRMTAIMLLLRLCVWLSPMNMVIEEDDSADPV